MKKILKIATVFALSCAFSAGTFLFSGCFSVQNYTGEYSYTEYGTDYGVKVNVALQSDRKGDRIRSVEIAESDYVEATDGEWWSDRSKWDDGLGNLLLSYRGKYLADILVTDVVRQESGAPSSVADPDLVISGATMGSGRLLLAVQNALSDAAQKLGYTFVEGEYKYENAWVAGAYYGIRVRVAVKDDTVRAVGVIDSPYTEASDWEGKPVWEEQLPALLKNYAGKNVSEINAVKVPCNEGGEPTSVPEESYVITGATVGSGRLLLAVQNALANL